MAEEIEIEIEGVSELPEEVLIEILSRLPVKSLIRFTCVCKYWLSLIRSHEFAIKQFTTRSMLLQQNHMMDCHFFMARDVACANIPKFYFLSYETLDISTIFECKPVNYDPSSSPDSRERIAVAFHGLCDGIFCLRIIGNSYVMLLWNPATREVFKPSQPHDLKCHSVGFGFDYKTNDYKIVMIELTYSNSTMLVYSLRANSWREKDAGIIFGRDHKYIDHYVHPSSNGRMYTWTLIDSQSKQSSLLSFDMVDEVLIHTPLPKDPGGFYYDFMQQRSNHTHPALFCFELDYFDNYDGTEPPYFSSFADIWVLNEYGPTGSWTKQQSFRWPEYLFVGLPKGLWKNEALLFLGEKDVFGYYNPITQLIISFKVPGREVLGYVESLVSIKNICQQPEELADSSTNYTCHQPGEPLDYDEDDRYQDILDIPYCLCESINQPTS